MKRKAVTKTEKVVLEKVPTAPATETKTTPSRTYYFIANRDRGDVVYPVVGQGGLRASSIIFPVGGTVRVEAEIWNDLKNRSGIKNFINAGILREVRKEGEVAVSTQSFAALPIPDTLKRDEEIPTAGAPELKASVRRKQIVTM